MICIPSQLLLECWTQGRWAVWGRWHVFGKRDMCIGVWQGNLEQEDDYWLRHAWEFNVKVDLKETGLEGLDWFDLAHNKDIRRAVVNAVMKPRVPSNAENFKFMVPCFAIPYYNNPTRCSCAQSILFHCRVTLHVSGAFHTHHQEYIKLYLQPAVQVIYRCSYLPPTWPSLNSSVPRSKHFSSGL